MPTNSHLFFLQKKLHRHFWGLILPILTLNISLSAGENPLSQIQTHIDKIPAILYSPEAYAYFARKGITLPPQPSIDDSRRGLLAIIKLTTPNVNVKDMLPSLVNNFYKAIHVTEIKNVRYNGEGTFEDWVYTYVASEKNKFLLASPFLDYNTMMLCENFIGSSHEITKTNGDAVSSITKEPVIISVTHTLYPAAYALSVITGEATAGIDQAKWQEWLNGNGATFSGRVPETATGSSAAGTPTYGTLGSGQHFSDIVRGGKYQLFMTTGNEMTGRVEAKDDTSLIFETTDGKAYTFKPNLISRFEFLEPPVTETKVAPVNTDMPFSFDELRGKQLGNRQIEVRVNSGMVFRGRLKEINAEMMQLDVGGSAIPITRDVTLNVRIVPADVVKVPVAAPPVRKSSVPQDTLITKNSIVNDWGVPGPDIIYAGSIVSEEKNSVIIKTDSLGDVTISRDKILRMVKNSTNSYEATIKRYAEPLFCPDDMFIVDIPPGKEGRPFFKVCIDRYEYPNVKGAAPQINVSYDDARALCAKKGKRLCTSDEWQYGCSGIEGYTFPYGWNPEKEKCNTDGNRPPEESGNRINCVSKFGGYDMAGNAFEWVTDRKKQPSIMGGPYSKCQTITEGVGGSAKPQTGFRCCKSN